MGILSESRLAMDSLQEAQEQINVRLDAIIVELRTTNTLLAEVAKTSANR